MWRAVASRSVAAVGYVLAWQLLGLLPASWVRKGFEAIAGRISPGEQLRENLRRLDPSADETLARSAMRSYARYWAEAFCLPRLMRTQDLWARIDAGVTGTEYLDASLSRGNGVVLTLPHSGNWDMAGVWLVGHAGTFTTVAERLRPAVLFDAFVDYRTALGFQVLPHSGQEGVFSRLQAELRRGGIVCLMGERDLKGRGVQVTLCDEPTTFPVGPAELARTTGAALHTVSSYFTPDGWGFDISPAIQVDTLPATAQRIADNFGVSLRAHPEDWHMLQPVWLADRG